MCCEWGNTRLVEREAGQQSSVEALYPQKTKQWYFISEDAGPER